ncbi:MAG TPA: sigma 54 modulation/S30EA ribosomal C-terminal domain-containing protein [Bradyrhizobium sp.]
MRMDLAELPTLMFRNSAHGGLNVVYRRNDGHIGWIDPRQADASVAAE